MLGEGRALAQCWAVPVDDIDGDDEDEGNARQDRRGVVEMAAAADVYLELIG